MFTKSPFALIAALVLTPACDQGDAEANDGGACGDQDSAGGSKQDGLLGNEGDAIKDSVDCSMVTSAIETAGLQEAFKSHPDPFIFACNANPGGKDLWPDDPEHDDKIANYCEISPLFRACFVCHFLGRDKDEPVSENFKDYHDACESLLIDGDQPFDQAIWGDGGTSGAGGDTGSDGVTTGSI